MACANQSTDKIHLSFDFGTASSNNGNLLEQTIWAPDNGSGSPWEVVQTYTYDAVNRLDTATEKKSAVTQWSRDYDYDHFGNRWISGATGHTLHMATPTSSSAIQATTNKLTGTGITYDNAGNMTAHPQITPGSGSMSYDANNKMTAFSASGVAVNTIYDATGKRVRKIYNGETTVWVYDAFGRLAAEYTTATQYDAPGVYYRTTDHLGSTRLVTDAAGAVKQRRDYFPFGEQIDDTLSGRSGVSDGGAGTYNASLRIRQQFTGQQRDEETGLDYFWARNYQAALGRFTSADASMLNERLDAPQSWNRCGYVENNPLIFTDPTGLSKCGDMTIFGAGPDGSDATLRELMNTREGNGEDVEKSLLARIMFAEGSTFSPGAGVRPGSSPGNGWNVLWYFRAILGVSEHSNMYSDHLAARVERAGFPGAAERVATSSAAGSDSTRAAASADGGRKLRA